MRIQVPNEVSSGISSDPTRSKPTVKSEVVFGVQVRLQVMRAWWLRGGCVGILTADQLKGIDVLANEVVAQG